MDLKQAYKDKVSTLMQEYELHQQQQQQHKQQVKKQVMMDLLKQRQHKHSQPAQRQKPPEEKVTMRKWNKPYGSIDKNTEEVPNCSNHNSVQGIEKLEENVLKYAEVTFNMKKSNLTSSELVVEQTERRQPKAGDLGGSYRVIAKRRAPLPIDRQDEPGEEDCVQNEREDINVPSLEKGRPVPLSNKQLKYVDHEEPDEDQEQYPRSTDIISGKSYFPHPSTSQQKQQHYISYEEDDSDEALPQREEQAYKGEEKEQEDQNRGVFLTMEESESMVAEEAPKALGFQIPANSHPGTPHDVQQRRLQKIKELEMKRKKNIEQFRRNQSQKKVETPKPRNSLKKKVQEKKQPEQLPPRSNNLARKQPGQTGRSPKGHSPIAVEQPYYGSSQHSVRPSSRQMSNQSAPYEDQPRGPVQKYGQVPLISSETKGHSPLRTPKTAQGDSRAKSKGRQGTIFNDREGGKQRRSSFTRQSNKKLMTNAITYVCLPGQLNRKDRERLIDVIEESQFQFFVFLFKEYSRKIIKGIYTLDQQQLRLQRVYGEKAPPTISAELVKEFYRFDSGSREFKKVDGCRSFSLAVHAVDLR